MGTKPLISAGSPAKSRHPRGTWWVGAMRVAADSVAFLGAFGVAYALRQWEPIQALRFPIQPLTFYVPLLPVALVLLLAVFWQHGLYAASSPTENLAVLVKTIRAVLLWTALLMAASYLGQLDPSRALILLTGATTLGAVVVARSGMQRWEHAWLWTPPRVLVVGSLEEAAPYRAMGTWEVAGIVSPEDAPGVRGTIADLPFLLRANGATVVVIASRSLQREAILNAVASAGHSAVQFRVPADLFPLLRGNFMIRDIEHDTVTLDLASPQGSGWMRFGKRAADVAVSLAVVPLALPAGCLIALAVWLDSGRPILFSHERTGRNGRPFRMLKFRTMVADTPALADSPRTPNDARVTRVGRWLRRWSLDELPQLWNILQGEMSLVGPRPEMPHLVAQYAPWQRMRFLVRPGLTGLWQVLGRKEYPLHEHLEYDVYYVNNVCASLDLAILLKTLPRIIGGRGAY